MLLVSWFGGLFVWECDTLKHLCEHAFVVRRHSVTTCMVQRKTI